VIDWFTVIAQIVNFVVLVFLLRYFLYDRIVLVMQKREEAIATRWQEAEQLLARAQEQVQQAEQQARWMDSQREAMLAQVRQEVEQLRQQLIEKVKQEVEQLRQQRVEALRQEEQLFLGDLRQRLTAQLFTVTRRVLVDLASAELETLVVAEFLKRLDQCSPSDWQKLFDGDAHGTGHVIVRTAFALAPAVQDQIVEKLRHLAGSEINVQFETTQDLTCGIAVLSNGHRIAWSVADYLDELEQNVRRALEQETAMSMSEKSSATLPVT